MVALPNLFTTPITVQRGDIWQLGQHRLMCGDSTSEIDVRRLFDGKTFRLCFTSPPYSDQREYKVGAFNWHSLMCGSFEQIVKHGNPDCHILINLGLSHKNRQVDMYWLGWLMQCSEMGWPVFGWYVWDKGSVTFRENDGRLFTSHEFIFHFNQSRNEANKWVETSGRKQYVYGYRRPNGKHEKIFSPDKVGQPFRVPASIISIHKVNENRQIYSKHPAVFPVALPEFMMHTWSQPHDIVYEPFCGSGTSIIAGENLNRRVYAMEIEPSYCELAIQRWQEKTCQQAIKL